MARIKSIAEHYHDYSEKGLEGARDLLQVYRDRISQAPSLPVLLEIHLAAAKCGLYNHDMEPISPSRGDDGRYANPVTFRTDADVTGISMDDVFLGNVDGRFTHKASFWEDIKDLQHDSYVKVLEQYRSFLDTQFGNISKALEEAQQEAHEENRRLNIFRRRQYPANEPDLIKPLEAYAVKAGFDLIPYPTRDGHLLFKGVYSFDSANVEDFIEDDIRKFMRSLEVKEIRFPWHVLDNKDVPVIYGNDGKIYCPESISLSDGGFQVTLNFGEHNAPDDSKHYFPEYFSVTLEPYVSPYMEKKSGGGKELLEDKRNNWANLSARVLDMMDYTLKMHPDNVTRLVVGTKEKKEKTDPLEYIRGRDFVMVEKSGRIEARPGIPGEEIRTVLADGTKETLNIVKEGDMVVNNVGSPEKWIVDYETFKRKYEQIPDKPAQYKPTGKPMRAYRVVEDMNITTPWGEIQTIKKGGYLLQDPENPKDIYGIGKDEFAKTYHVSGEKKAEEKPSEDLKKPEEDLKKPEEQKPAVSSAPKISKSNAAALGKQHKDILCRTLDAAAGEKIFATPVIIDGEGHQLPKEDGVSCSLMRSFYEDWLPDMLTLDEIRELGCDIVSPDVKPYLCKGVAHSDGTIGTQLRYNLADTTFPEQQPEVYRRFCEYRRNEEKAMCSDFYKDQKGVIDGIGEVYSSATGMNEVMAREILDRYPQYEEYKQYIKTILYHNIAANLGEESLCGNFRPRTGITLPDDQTAYKIHRAVGVYLENKYEGTSRRTEFAPAKDVINTIKNNLQEQKNEAMRRRINGPENGQGKGKGIK